MGPTTKTTRFGVNDTDQWEDIDQDDYADGGDEKFNNLQNHGLNQRPTRNMRLSSEQDNDDVDSEDNNGGLTIDMDEDDIADIIMQSSDDSSDECDHDEHQAIQIK